MPRLLSLKHPAAGFLGPGAQGPGLGRRSGFGPLHGASSFLGFPSRMQLPLWSEAPQMETSGVGFARSRFSARPARVSVSLSFLWVNPEIHPTSALAPGAWAHRPLHSPSLSLPRADGRPEPGGDWAPTPAGGVCRLLPPERVLRSCPGGARRLAHGARCRVIPGPGLGAVGGAAPQEMSAVRLSGWLLPSASRAAAPCKEGNERNASPILPGPVLSRRRHPPPQCSSLRSGAPAPEPRGLAAHLGRTKPVLP